jgi:energy-coupling factor transporter ATP-binding protein EcfA2
VTILLEQVSYRYPAASVPAIREAALEVRSGTVVGLVGANDSGKTTLCHLAAGLAPNFTGGQLSGRAERSDGCALVMQNPVSQLSTLHDTVFDEVAFGPCNHGVPAHEVIARVDAALETLGIAHLAARHPERLSGGETQLVALAAALALRAPDLVLDEPASYLDESVLALLSRVIRELAAGGAGILVADHRTGFVAAACDLVAVLAEGRIVLVGSASKVLRDPRLAGWGVAPPEP